MSQPVENDSDSSVLSSLAPLAVSVQSLIERLAHLLRPGRTPDLHHIVNTIVQMCYETHGTLDASSATERRALELLVHGALVCRDPSASFASY